MRICLLRHGRSLADDERKIEGRHDSPLTKTGRRQAEGLPIETAMRDFETTDFLNSTIIATRTHGRSFVSSRESNRAKGSRY